MFGSHESGTHHVGYVDRRLVGHVIGDMGHVCVSLVDVDVVGERAVFDVSELPAAERLGRL